MKKWYKSMKVLTFFVIIPILFFMHCTRVFAEIPESGPVKDLKDVRQYKDEEFEKYPVRLNIFTASWCNRCARLKQTLPKEIYEKFAKEQVAIRIWEIDDSKVIPYFAEMDKKADVPKEALGSVPSIFINETYYYAGYDSKITEMVMEDIDAILKGEAVSNGGNLQVNKKKSTDKESLQQDNKEGTNGGPENAQGKITGSERHEQPQTVVSQEIEAETGSEEGGLGLYAGIFILALLFLFACSTYFIRFKKKNAHL